MRRKDLTFNEKDKSVFYDGEKIDLLVYTGAVDELFHLSCGELPYRSLDIRYDWYDVDRKLPEAITSYPQAKGYTRKTEYKFMMYDIKRTIGTVIATEYPIAYVKDGTKVPFYPVITEETKQIYASYQKKAQQYKNIFCVVVWQNSAIIIWMIVFCMLLIYLMKLKEEFTVDKTDEFYKINGATIKSKIK